MTAPTATYPPFATAEQLAALIGRDPGPAGQLMLDAASATVRRYCGWHIAPVLVQDLVLDPHGGTVLSLPTGHLLAVQALTVLLADGSTVTPAPADVEWSADGYLRLGSWGHRPRSVATTIEHGYPLVDCADLTQLCLSVSARAVGTAAGVSQQAIGSVSVSYSTSPSGATGVVFYPDELAALDRYRLFRRA